jgi:hypothetical protein
MFDFSVNFDEVFSIEISLKHLTIEQNLVEMILKTLRKIHVHFQEN